MFITSWDIVGFLRQCTRLYVGDGYARIFAPRTCHEYYKVALTRQACPRTCKIPTSSGLVD